jgi:phage FluMu protein Com
MPYSVPRCPHCGKPALRDKRDAEEVAVAAAAMMRGTLRCRSCGKDVAVGATTDWVEIGED